MKLFQHKHHRHEARAALPEAQPVADPAQTLVSIVYVTATPTFTGAIGGYTTIGVEETPAAHSQKPQAVSTHSSTTATVEPSIVVAPSSSTHTVAPAATSSKSTPSVILAPSTTVASSIALLAASSITTSTKASSQTSASTSSTASATAAADSSSSDGMSTGGKVGLAFGIICLIGVALSLALFFFKKRKDAAKRDRLEDEKHDIFAAGGVARAPSTRTSRTASTAPRLSLRPVTQFIPNLSNERRSSRGNALVLSQSPQNMDQSRGLSPTSAWRGPHNGSRDGQESNKDNPFGNHAEAIDATNANGPSVVEGARPNGETVAAGAAAGAIVAPTAAGLVRGASKRGNGPKPLDLTKQNARGPPSPAPTEFSMTSEMGTPTQAQSSKTGAAIAAAGGPANSAVHRVQLDFKPSMDDELELSAGQLIRLLHEYDDGWALCIRLDRSQQGVVPRTCLSTRPVKPRPQQNGPRGPGVRPQQQHQQRPMSPAVNQGPPRSGPPAGNQPMNPNDSQGQPRATMPSAPMAHSDRPMTPTGNQSRPMTPNGGAQQPMTPTGQRNRSPSVAQTQAPRNGPPGPSPMNPQSQVPTTAPESAASQVNDRPQGPPPAVQRKPVGQAL